MNKSKNQNILNGLGIHIHGGMSVLDVFLKIKFNNYLIDSRSKDKKFNKLNNITYINSSLYSRLKSEFHLKKLSNKNKLLKITYLGGLPPLFNSHSFNICCFQNANIFPEFYKNYRFISWLFSKDFIRYLYFHLFKNNTDLWVVFSPISKRILINNNIQDYKIKELNIFNEGIKALNKTNKKRIYDFVYPASFKPHKNHKNLIQALIILSKKNIRPKILLTLNKIEKEQSKIEFYKKKYNLNLFFYFSKDRKKFLKIYDKCKALIYPSFNETIGLPIIEAKNKKLLLVCADKPYTDQFFNVDIKFNPNDPISIANAMRKALMNKFRIRKSIKGKSSIKQIEFYKNDINTLKNLFI